MIPSIQIREATTDDLAECAECWGDVSLIYRSIYPWRLRQSHITHQQRMQRNARQLLKELNDPQKAFFVAVWADDASIAGYSIWQRPMSFVAGQDPHQASNDTSRAEEQDPEVNYELLAEISAESASVKARFCGETTWFLHHLFILTSRQRQGVGAALIKHGLDWIDEHHRQGAYSHDPAPKIALTSTPDGLHLYRRYGFHDVYWFRPQWDDIDADGSLRRRSVEWPLMLNYASATEAAAAGPS